MTTGRINQVTISNAVESESINRVALAGARDDRSLSLKDSIARKDASDTSRSLFKIALYTHHKLPDSVST